MAPGELLEVQSSIGAIDARPRQQKMGHLSSPYSFIIHLLPTKKDTFGAIDVRSHPQKRTNTWRFNHLFGPSMFDLTNKKWDTSLRHIRSSFLCFQQKRIWGYRCSISPAKKMKSWRFNHLFGPSMFDLTNKKWDTSLRHIRSSFICFQQKRIWGYRCSISAAKKDEHLEVQSSIRAIDFFDLTSGVFIR